MFFSLLSVFHNIFFQFHISDVVLMVFPKFSSLLSISLHQIIYCSFPLKIASAKLCSMLFSSGNRLSKQVRYWYSFFYLMTSPIYFQTIANIFFYKHKTLSFEQLCGFLTIFDYFKAVVFVFSDVAAILKNCPLSYLLTTRKGLKSLPS